MHIGKREKSRTTSFSCSDMGGWLTNKVSGSGRNVVISILPSASIRKGLRGLEYTMRKLTIN